MISYLIRPMCFSSHFVVWEINAFVFLKCLFLRKLVKCSLQFLSWKELHSRVFCQKPLQLFKVESSDFVSENLAFPLSPDFLSASNHDFNLVFRCCFSEDVE